MIEDVGVGDEVLFIGVRVVVGVVDFYLLDCDEDFVWFWVGFFWLVDEFE